MTLIGASLARFIVNPDKEIGTDGADVNQARNPSWKMMFFSLYVALKTDPWIILLFPMFFASNYFNTWRSYVCSLD